MTATYYQIPPEPRAYIREVRRQPMLSREEEASLARRSIGGDAAAARRLVMSHLRFVIKIARSYRNYGLPMTDLVQEGTIGLIHAVRKFNPDRDTRLSTYAVWWIRAAMQEYVFRSWSLVRVGTTSAHKALFLNLRRRAGELMDAADSAGEDLAHRLAARFGVPVREVLSMARRATRSDRSLNVPIGDRAGGDWIERVPDGRPNPEELLARASTLQFWRGVLARAMDALSPREQFIIQRRYLAEAASTFEALGRELDLSKERVRQLEKSALEKLKRALMPARSGEDLPA